MRQTLQSLTEVVKESYINSREVLGVYVPGSLVWKDPYLQFSTNVSFCGLNFHVIPWNKGVIGPRASSGCKLCHIYS